MRIAYLYERDPREGVEMDCEKTFADFKGTKRGELTLMIESGGVRKGDTLCLRALGDLGRGQEAQRIQRVIEAMGVSIEIIPPPERREFRGRPAKVKPTEAQREHLCRLWYSPAPLQHVLERAADIMGRDVGRSRMYRWCGPRDGSDKPEE